MTPIQTLQVTKSARSYIQLQRTLGQVESTTDGWTEEDFNRAAVRAVIKVKQLGQRQLETADEETQTFAWALRLNLKAPELAQKTIAEEMATWS